MKSESHISIIDAARHLLTLGFSPCPNDTFMFDAMVNGRINTGDYKFDVQLEDVETLNRMALEEELDITKISFAVYPEIKENYQLLTSGSALGNGVGPLFISKKSFSDPAKQIRTVAIPGHHTTAYYLFKKFYPQLTNVREYVFSEIESALLNEEVDAGVIIHENRFTYESKGLLKIADLGDLWEKETGLPIPLGGIVIRRSLSNEIKQNINRFLKQSIEFAFKNPDASKTYVRDHSQEMSEEITKKHIELYVNQHSLQLDELAKKAITRFLQTEEGDIFVSQ